MEQPRPAGVGVRSWPVGLVIVAIERAHLPLVLDLCAREGWTTFVEDPERAWRALTAPGVTTVVALVDDEAAGFAQVQSDGEIQAHLSNLLVAEAYRRAGVGRRLIEEAVRRAGGMRVDLLAWPGSEAFYRSFPHKEWTGFRIYP